MASLCGDEKNRGRQKERVNECEGERKSKQESGREGGKEEEREEDSGKERWAVGKKGKEKDLLIPPSQENG